MEGRLEQERRVGSEHRNRMRKAGEEQSAKESSYTPVPVGAGKVEDNGQYAFNGDSWWVVEWILPRALTLSAFYD
ncbi:hypothetical protein DL767_006963 [Monosporascus sp. MG133]|nr:hypothetical protein DL767_006963 [Monosporascus sp. MG133]